MCFIPWMRSFCLGEKSYSFFDRPSLLLHRHVYISVMHVLNVFCRTLSCWTGHVSLGSSKAYLACVELRVCPYAALRGSFMLLCVFSVSNKTYLACIVSKRAVAVCRVECVYEGRSLWRKSSRTAALRDDVLYKGWYRSPAKTLSCVYTMCCIF